VALGLLASAGPWALDHPGAARSLAAFQPTDRALLLQLLEHGLHCPWTSSLGRLFDGVASLLGVCQRLRYEGEAALRLQGLASEEGAWAEEDWPGEGSAHPFPRAPSPAAGLEALPLGWIDWQPALAALLAERAAGVPRRISAARFHRGLADGLAALLANAAAARSCRVVVLAGGCFQNSLLLEALIQRLRRSGLEPHWAAAVPPNDGGLALGQLEALRRASRLHAGWAGRFSPSGPWTSAAGNEPGVAEPLAGGGVSTQDNGLAMAGQPPAVGGRVRLSSCRPGGAELMSS
jgi:hydrogenase maturation protein HypF